MHVPNEAVQTKNWYLIKPKKCSLGRMDRLETQLTPTIRISKKHVEHMGSVNLNQTTYWQWFMWWETLEPATTTVPEKNTTSCRNKYLPQRKTSIFQVQTLKLLESSCLSYKAIRQSWTQILAGLSVWSVCLKNAECDWFLDTLPLIFQGLTLYMGPLLPQPLNI